jgi:hypothetical protein
MKDADSEFADPSLSFAMAVSRQGWRLRKSRLLNPESE